MLVISRSPTGSLRGQSRLACETTELVLEPIAPSPGRGDLGASRGLGAGAGAGVARARGGASYSLMEQVVSLDGLPGPEIAHGSFGAVHTAVLSGTRVCAKVCFRVIVRALGHCWCASSGVGAMDGCCEGHRVLCA
jgi:hypothetical protein